MGIALEWNMIMTFVCALVVLFFISCVFNVSTKMLAMLLVNSILGGVFLMAVNFFGQFFNFYIPVTVATCMIIGVFGVFGLVIILFCLTVL